MSARENTGPGQLLGGATEGFQVNLTQLGDYITALQGSQQMYATIEGQLEDADLAKKEPDFKTLVGHPHYGGTQQEFTQSCRDFLTTYKNLYTQIHDLNHQISGKLNFMVQEFIGTHKLYLQAESTHAGMFDSLRNGLTSRGGSDGTAEIR
jgi:hypothetical protein